MRLISDPTIKFRNLSFGILMRSMFESSLRGMLNEYLSRVEFRGDLKNGQTYFKDDLRYCYAYDTVGTLVYDLSNMWREDRSSKMPFDYALKLFNMGLLEKGTPEKRQEITDPSFSDLLRWLIKWGAFESIPNAQKELHKIWRDLNRYVHPSPEKVFRSYQQTYGQDGQLDPRMEKLFSSYHQTYVKDGQLDPIYSQETVLETMRKILDLILVGALTTSRNLNKQVFQVSINAPWSENPVTHESDGKTVYEKLEEIASSAGFPRLLAWLELYNPRNSA